MGSSRERLCDYFAVVGPREQDLENRVVQEAYSIGSLHRALEEAIVDVCIVNCPKDPIPFEENYELLLKPEQAEEGMEGGKLQLAKHLYLCFRRRKHNKTPSYITDVRLVRKGQEPVPEGFELIEKTVGGGSADLTRNSLQYQTFLAVKRTPVDERAFRFSTPPMLLDLCLCSDKNGGAAPLDYEVLPRALPRMGLAQEEIYLAYRHGPQAGLCDVPYDAHTLECFPPEDTYDDFPLPQNELPMFCFPQGLSLRHQKRDNAPMPSYFSFVFTSIDGDRVHVACLQFWELLPDRVLRALEAKQRILTVVGGFSPGALKGQASGAVGEWDHEDDGESSVEDGEEDEETTDAESDAEGAGKHHHHRHHHHQVVKAGARTLASPSAARGGPGADEDASYGLFAPKCICIISHWPFYHSLRSFLQQIYRISLSPAAVPLERYIAYFTHYMPLPPPGSHALHLHLDLGLQDPVENSSLAPIALRLPDARSLPLMDLDYEAPFRCLSLENVLRVFVLLLLEERLLFVSSSTSLLTEVTETILTLLFPLEWLSCYIPRLPSKLHEILDAPGSFLIGIYTEGGTDTWTAPQLSDPIFIVDLDHNRITDAEGKGDYLQAMEGLPILDALRDRVKAELERAAVGPVKSAEALRERDSAFELPAVPGAEGAEGGDLLKPKLNPDVVRDAFLVFMCELLGPYTRFFNSQEATSGKGGMEAAASQGVFGAFDVQAFVASADKAAKPLLDRLVLTQMFAALVQQRTEHGRGVDRLVFFETCVQELRERREAEAAAAANPSAAKRSPAPGSAAASGAAARQQMLLHHAVASIVRQQQQQQQQQQQGGAGAEALVVPGGGSSPMSSPATGGAPSSPRGAALAQQPSQLDALGGGKLPSTIILPGPGADGCGEPGASYSYPQFPVRLNKEWMSIPPSALPPVLVEIISRRRKYMKKGNRMILARSVSECMKDWQAVGAQIGSGTGGRNKELYLAMQIFGIYFMCLPSRVSYKGRPLKVIMQAMGLLQFLLDFQLERYMDEAMWRSLLVACGRCGHGSTRKIAIALFGIMRRAGITINALTYGQYTKALAEKDALEFQPGPATGAEGAAGASSSGGGGAAVVEPGTPTSTGSLQSAGGEGGEGGALGRLEMDDCPWLEERGRAWYTATCEPPPPETLKSGSVADSFKSLLAKAAAPPKASKQAKRERAPLQEGDFWTQDLRDPKLAAHNTTLSSVTADRAAGVIGMWVVCLCVHCEYMPLDEEIMTLRQDLLLVQAANDHANHLLLCPKCESPLMPRLYYDVKTFDHAPHAAPASTRPGYGPLRSTRAGSCGGGDAALPRVSEATAAATATAAAAPATATAPVDGAAAPVQQQYFAAVVVGGATAPAQSSSTDPTAPAPTPLAAPTTEASAPPALASTRAASASASASASSSLLKLPLLPTREPSLPMSAAMRGEISGLGLATTGGDHVDYLSPFTLRMRLEKLLLEHGEECLTRDWARQHHPELYWNLVWFTTRLSLPFPFLLVDLSLLTPVLDPNSALATPGGCTAPGLCEVGEKKKKKKRGEGSQLPTSDPPLRAIRRGMSRQDSVERLAQLYFHEVVVVGWEGGAVRARCEKVEALLKERAASPTAAVVPASSSSTGKALSKMPSATGAGGPSASSSVPTFLSLGETIRSQLTGGSGAATAVTTDAGNEAIGPLTVEEMFPNISAQELEALNEVKKTLVAKGCPGLKDAITQFFTLRHKQGGWTSEASLGSAYRVFLKLAANHRVKKLHNIAPVTNLMANPGLEHEYTTAVMKLGERFLRDKDGKDEKQLLAELPRRDAIKFRSVFGHLY